MKLALGAFVAGSLFALGLLISGMTDPTKVIGFLDITGNWDPTLLFVMGSAVPVYFIASRFILKRRAPVVATRWHLPESKRVTPSLLLGATLFGVGWGLSGYCPGPAIVSLVSFQAAVWVFVAALLLGMVLAQAAPLKSR